MPSQMVRQTMFNVGEADVSVWKRTEVPEYLAAAQSLLNCEVGTTGLVKKRKGTSLLYNATAYAQFNSKMYEFVDKNGDYYVLLSAGGTFYILSTPANEINVITIRGNVVTSRGTNVVAVAGNLQFIQPIPVPYQTGDIDSLDYTQDNDAIIFTHPNYSPGRIYVSQYNGVNPPTFAFQYLDIYPLPSYDFNTINYNNFTVALSVAGNILTFQFTGLASDPGFTNAWIGGQIIGGGVSEVDPIGYAIITAVSYSAGTVTFTATVQIAFLTTGYDTQGSQYSIRQPIWTSPPAPFPAPNPIVSGYPTKVLFFQNRLWMANTNLLPATVFGSKINSPINYDVGTGRDTDAIVYTIGQTDTGSIQWLNGGKQMEIFAQNFEFACPQDQNSALTPSTFSIRQQSSYGSSSSLKPVTYINDSYYCTKAGKALINYHFNGIGQTYSSSNISISSSHLVKEPTNRALLRGSDTSQDNFIYFLNPTDDTITAFQFASEYKLAALTPIQFQDNIELVDIVTINNSVYILKYYTLTNQYTIEQFDEEQFIDCSFSATMDVNGNVNGLDLLNGYTVQVVYQDQDFGQYLVSAGHIDVSNEGFSGTVSIGLLYDVEIRPMYFFGGAQASPFFKQVSRIYVDYFESLNFYINGTLVPYQSFSNPTLIPQTDTAIISPVSGYDRFSTFSITQSAPFNLQITAIAYQIDTAVI